MKISSIAPEVGALIRPVTSTKRADPLPGGPATPANSAATDQLVSACRIGDG